MRPWTSSIGEKFGNIGGSRKTTTRGSQTATDAWINIKIEGKDWEITVYTTQSSEGIIEKLHFSQIWCQQPRPRKNNNNNNNNTNSH